MLKLSKHSGRCWWCLVRCWGQRATSIRHTSVYKHMGTHIIEDCVHDARSAAFCINAAKMRTTFLPIGHFHAASSSKPRMHALRRCCSTALQSGVCCHPRKVAQIQQVRTHVWIIMRAPQQLTPMTAIIPSYQMTPCKPFVKKPNAVPMLQLARRRYFLHGLLVAPSKERRSSRRETWLVHGWPLQNATFQNFWECAPQHHASKEVDSTDLMQLRGYMAATIAPWKNLLRHFVRRQAAEAMK